MNRDNRNDRWNENRNRYQQDDQYSNWQNSNQQMDDNRNRGGFMGRPGSNYAAGTFSGAAYGRGLTEDNYKGYDNTGNIQGNFANNYNAAYGDRWNENRTGAYSSDYDYQNQGQESSRSGLGKLTSGHRGKGPRGYHRSDERIQEDVNDRLSDDSYVDASGIEVSVENGTIILSGHVPDRQAKRRAEDIAESVRGINNVENRLRVGEGIMENATKALMSGLGDVTVGNDREKR